MRVRFFLFIISIILFLASCESDNFYNTERIITTDKTMYCIGDSILITLKIAPLKSEPKEIRVFDDMRNIKLFPYSKSAIISDNFYKFDKSGNINTVVLTKDKFFSKTLKGIIQADTDRISIKFKNYNQKIELDKSTYENSPDLAIGGICLPINPEPGAPLEEVFIHKEIAILNCEDQERPVSLSN